MDTVQFHNLLIGWATLDDAHVSTETALSLYHRINAYFAEDREAATREYLTFKMLHPEMSL